MRRFCPHCGEAIGHKAADDAPFLIGWHTITWPHDGLRVTRIAQHRGAIYLELEWRGSVFEARLLKTKGEIELHRKAPPKNALSTSGGLISISSSGIGGTSE